MLKGISPGILRWSLTLAGYDCTIGHCEGKYYKNSEALSRLPPPKTVNKMINLSDVMLVSNSDDWLVTSKTIVKWTTENPVIKQSLEGLLYG